MDQESGHSLTGSPAPGPISLQSTCWLGCILIGSSTSSCTVTHVVGRIHFLTAMGLRPSAPTVCLFSQAAHGMAVCDFKASRASYFVRDHLVKSDPFATCLHFAMECNKHSSDNLSYAQVPFMAKKEDCPGHGSLGFSSVYNRPFPVNLVLTSIPFHKRNTYTSCVFPFF